MIPLTESEKEELNYLLASGRPLPEQWWYRLFPENSSSAEVGKEYRLVYEGKLKREEVLAQTPAAPWQLEREFCTERPHGDGWRNLLVWGGQYVFRKSDFDTIDINGLVPIRGQRNSNGDLKTQ